ncbi:hypothetical protein V8D89_002575, partial [Ganoderma adspersum]
LYKLLQSQLAQQLDHFSALFSLKPIDPGEGMSDTNPIILPGVTASEFDHICAFITGQFNNIVEELASLLNLGTFLQMSRPRTYAIRQLNAQPSWSPFLKLHLSIHNQISEWVQDAFCHIVHNIPLDDITIDNMLCIGGPAYWAIVRAKTRILEHRLLLMFNWPEATHSPTMCHLSTACGIAWKSEWWYMFTKCILYPEKKISPTEVTNTQYMQDECKALTIQAVREDGGLEQSKEIIEEALSTLVQFLHQLS